MEVEALCIIRAADQLRHLITVEINPQLFMRLTKTKNGQSWYANLVNSGNNCFTWFPKLPIIGIVECVPGVLEVGVFVCEHERELYKVLLSTYRPEFMIWPVKTTPVLLC